MKLRPRPEAEIKRAITDALKLLGWTVFRLNSGTFNIGDRFIAGLPAGTTDLLCFRPLDPIAIWVETKRKGKKQSPDQIAFQRWAETQGTRYILAYSIEDVMEGVK